MKRVMGLLVLIITLGACSKMGFYERYADVKNYSWAWSDKKGFGIDIKDTSTLYNLYVNVRHTTYYPYSNLWVKIYTVMPDGKTLSKRIELPLADVKEEKWYGEGMGDICDAQIMLQQHMFFDKPGSYYFEIEQNMRQNPLPGIMSIGLKLEDMHQHRLPKQITKKHVTTP